MAITTRRLLTSMPQWMAAGAILNRWLASPARAASAFRPEIYFYPTPYRLADGTLASSPLTLGEDQMTTLFPQIPEMSGVVLMMPWSALSPVRGQYDFTTIDNILKFWAPRGKQVVVGISTSGPPFKTVRNGVVAFQSETPDWVAALTTTYQTPENTIGHTTPPAPVPTAVPAYWDPRFAPLYIDAIRAFGHRYDGNPTISYVRIGTGRVGEDSPAPFGPHPEKAPGYNPAQWIGYSQRIVDAYKQAFPRSQLEFDISFMPWVYAAGDAGVKQAVDQFVTGLVRDKIFIAFNGWQADAAQWHDHAEQPGNPLNRLMHYLNQDVQTGRQIGLEGVGPMFVPTMQDIDKMAKLAHDIRPKRLVFFGIDAAGIAFVRNGPSPATATSEAWLSADKLKATGALSIQLLAGIKQ